MIFFFLEKSSSHGCVRFIYDVCAAGKGVAKCRLKKPIVLSEMKWLCILKARIVQIVVGEGFFFIGFLLL
jgi:hypothetical protein